MFDVIAEDLVEGRRVAGVPVSRDLFRRCSGDRHGRAEERLGGFLIAGLAQVDVDQVAVAVDRPVQILPLASHPDVGFIDIPAAAGLAFSSLTQSSCANFASQSRTASWLKVKLCSSRIYHLRRQMKLPPSPAS